MNITDTVVSPNTGTLTCRVDNVRLKYLSAIRRTILADIPSYAFDVSDTKIVKNTSKNNNDELIGRISMLPVNSLFAYSLHVVNDGPEPIDITTSDVVLYQIDSDDFLSYMQGADQRAEVYLAECRKKVVGNSYISNKKKQTISNASSNSSNPTNSTPGYTSSIANRVREMAKKSGNTDVEDTDAVTPSVLFLHPDIQIVSLDVGETIDLYGFSCSGTPRDHVKWQEHTMFFRMCKEYPKMNLNWDTHMDRMVSAIISIDSEEKYETHKGLVGKLLYKTDSYSDFCKESFPSERVLELKSGLCSMIKGTCLSVYNGDVDNHSKHTRCTRCLERIAHLLELPVQDLYEPVRTDVYQVTIRSDSGIGVIYPLWEQAKHVLVERFRYLIHIMDSILLSIKEHSSMIGGYTLTLDSCTHTIGGITSYEMSRDSRLTMASYNHKHPTDTCIELVMVPKNLPDTIDNVSNLLGEILTDVFYKAIEQTNSISSIPSPST